MHIWLESCSNISHKNINSSSVNGIVVCQWTNRRLHSSRNLHSHLFARHTYCIDRGQGLILLGRSIQFFPTWIPPLSSKILQKVTFKRCLQFITQFQLKISHALRFLSNQENVYCAFSCDLDYHGYGFQVCPNMTIGECFNATSFKWKTI